MEFMPLAPTLRKKRSFNYPAMIEAELQGAASLVKQVDLSRNESKKQLKKDRTEDSRQNVLPQLTNLIYAPVPKKPKFIVVKKNADPSTRNARDHSEDPY